MLIGSPSQNINPFVYVLIDGEGYNVSLLPDSALRCMYSNRWSQIHEGFLKNGKTGGEGLASHLREEVLSLLQSNMDARNWKIMVSFYIDVGTVFARCVSADVKITEDCLREFVCGFNQAQPLFDLVDVGRGRKQTVLKIQGTKIHLHGSEGSPTDTCFQSCQAYFNFTWEMSIVSR
jgi:hypothetical protein